MMSLTSYEKGRAEGQRALVERLLVRRFGPLPAQALERLAALSGDQLTALGEALLTTSSLQELGLQE